MTELLFGAIHGDKNGGVHTPTTMYFEKFNDGPDGRSMCLETPLTVVHYFQEAVLQSWEGVMRVFEGLPDQAGFANVSFAEFRAQGGALVSARRLDGKTQFIQLRSPASQSSNSSNACLGPTFCVSASSMPQPWVSSLKDVELVEDILDGDQIVKVVGLKPNQTVVR